ncbi:MAG: DUF5131 family protein [Bradyrhizobium sp.]|uniref:DUF5131 family protein n=1 Tax=Bradyrhizobium sp. TaxID=376 RepID=UPI003C7DCCF7
MRRSIRGSERARAKISPACDRCYAARDNERRKWVDGWGTGVPRRRTKTWGDPLKWNRKAELTGYRPRVFCASLADVFDMRSIRRGGMTSGNFSGRRRTCVESCSRSG